MRGDSIKIVKSDVLIVGSGGAGLRAAIELHDNKVDALVVGKCEKRDAHYRLDCKKTDPKWRKNIICKRTRAGF